MPGEPKPQLQHLLEQTAAALDLDEGIHALVLRFVDGELVAFGSGRNDDRPPAELAQLDSRFGWLRTMSSETRRELETVLREVGDRVGVDLTRAHAEISFRLENGRVRWIDPGRLKVPISELERSE